LIKMSLKVIVNDIYNLLDITIDNYVDKLNILCVIFNLRSGYLLGDWESESDRDIRIREFMRLNGKHFDLAERYTQPESNPNIRIIYSTRFNPWIRTYKITDDNSLIVCESGGLRRKINPGVFLLLNRKDVTEFKPGVKELAKLADKIITFDDGNFNIDLEKILVSRNSWKIRD